MEVARAKGKVIGRKPTSINTKKEIISLRQQGMSMNKIAKKMSVGNGVVHRICKEMVNIAA